MSAGHRTRHRLTSLSLLWACSLLAGPLTAATADLEAVRRALGDSGAVSLSGSPDSSARVVEALAKLATTQLGQGNRDWTPGTPRWQSVYAQVRADLEAEAPQLTAELSATTRQHLDRLVGAVAAAVSDADVQAILTYYDTAQGKRYVALMSSLDQLFASGYSPPPGFDPKVPPDSLPEEQTRQLLEFMGLSRTMQSVMAAQQLLAAAHEDTSGLGGVGFFMGLILRYHQPQVVALRAEYSADTAAFAEFERTPAAQSLFQALARATFLVKPPQPPAIAEVLAAAQQRHQKAWQEIYQQSAP